MRSTDPASYIWILTCLLALANSSSRVPNAYSFSRKWLLPIKGDHKGKSTSPVHSVRLPSKVITYKSHVCSGAVPSKAGKAAALPWFSKIEGGGHYRGLTWLGHARRTGGAPAVKLSLLKLSYFKQAVFVEDQFLFAEQFWLKKLEIKKTKFTSVTSIFMSILQVRINNGLAF